MVRAFAYGPSPAQVGDLWLPGGDGPHPVAAIWHGGGYVAEVDRCIMEGVARDLCRRGWAVWNLEYRRLGSGGGWPQTFSDAADGLDRLASIDAPLDLDRVVAIGFSAGGPLALLASARAEGLVRPILAINQAGLANLTAAADADGVDRHVRGLLGDPADNGEAYALADPVSWLPLGVPQLHVHGADDEQIPVSLTEGFVERAREAGDDVELVVVPGDGHFAHNDPDSQAWAVVVERLEAL